MPTPRNSSPPPSKAEAERDVVLRLEGLGKSFYLHEQQKFVPSASGISFEVAAGELVALTGPSGAGKSSLLKSIYRTYLPSAGAIRYSAADGRTVDLASAPESKIVALREREIGFVTQFLHCLPRQATLDVVARPLLRLGVQPDEARERARSLLTRLGMPARLHDIAPATFSGGERQRVNIARGLILRRRLLLLDEPTASLDAAARDRVIALIEEEKKAGAAILAVFHDKAIISALADRNVAVEAPMPATGMMEAV